MGRAHMATGSSAIRNVVLDSYLAFNTKWFFYNSRKCELKSGERIIYL